MTAKKETTKPVTKKRVEVYTRKCCGFDGTVYNAGEICTSDDEDFLLHLTELDLLKAKVI